MRNDSDYDDYYDVSQEEVIELMNDVERLISLIDQYLTKRYNQ